MSDVIEEGESRLPLSDDEQRALELYDRLQELRLEIAIINAQQSLPTGKLGAPPILASARTDTKSRCR